MLLIIVVFSPKNSLDTFDRLYSVSKKFCKLCKKTENGKFFWNTVYHRLLDLRVMYKFVINEFGWDIDIIRGTSQYPECPFTLLLLYAILQSAAWPADMVCIRDVRMQRQMRQTHLQAFWASADGSGCKIVFSCGRGHARLKSWLCCNALSFDFLNWRNSCNMWRKIANSRPNISLNKDNPLPWAWGAVYKQICRLLARL